MLCNVLCCCALLYCAVLCCAVLCCAQHVKDTWLILKDNISTSIGSSVMIASKLKEAQESDTYFVDICEEDVFSISCFINRVKTEQFT